MGAIHHPLARVSPASAETARLPSLAALQAPAASPTTRASHYAAPADLPDVKTIVSAKPLAVMGTDLANGTTVAQTAKTRMMAMYRSTLLAAFTAAARDRQIHTRQEYVLAAFTDLTKKVLEIDHAVRYYEFNGSTDEAKHADSVSIGPIHGILLFDTIIQIWTVPACAGAVREWDAYYQSKVKRLREGFAAAMNSSASRIRFSKLVTYMEDFSAQLQLAIGGFIKEANKFASKRTSHPQAEFSLFDAHGGWLRKLMDALPQTDSQLGSIAGHLSASSATFTPFQYRA